MWKVVAADDEGYIREALKKLINWEKMNCDLVSVLEDGQELIQCIENESPDIVITDIQMPPLLSTWHSPLSAGRIISIFVPFPFSLQMLNL